MDNKDTERHVPEREKELRKLRGEEEGVLEVEGEEEEEEKEVKEDPYDIVQEQKKKKQEKKKEIKDLAEMSKDIMSSKNRKLLKAIEIGKRKDRMEN